MASLFDQAFAPFDTAPRPQGGNILSEILGGGFNPQVAQDTSPLAVPQVGLPGSVSVPQVQQRSPRERTSILDIIGGVADAVATVGGSTAQYQPTIDAREDRARQLELDELRKRISEQTIQQNDQTLDNTGREQLGQALAGIVGSQNPAEDFATIAQVVGIPPAQAAAIQAELARNPAAAEQLATAFGFQPQRQGTLPKEIQIFQTYRQLLATEGQEAADQFLEIARDDALSPFQEETIGVRRESNQIARERIAAQERIASQKPSRSAGSEGGSLETLAATFRANRGVIDDMKRAIDDLAEAGSINAPGQTALGRAGAGIFRSVPFVEQVFNEKGFDARARLNSAGLKAITALEPLIQQASGSGVKLTSKMMDTPKELEVRLETVMNAKTRGAAIEAWKGFKQRFEEAERDLEAQIKRAQGSSGGRTTRGGSLDPALEAELRRRGLR